MNASASPYSIVPDDWLIKAFLTLRARREVRTSLAIKGSIYHIPR